MDRGVLLEPHGSFQMDPDDHQTTFYSKVVFFQVLTIVCRNFFMIFVCFHDSSTDNETLFIFMKIKVLARLIPAKNRLLAVAPYPT